MATPKRKSTTAVVGDIAKQDKTENSASISKFEKNLVQEYSKTDLDRKKEELGNWLFKVKNSCKGGINTLIYQIGVLEGSLLDRDVSLEIAKNHYEIVRFRMTSDWESYFENRQSAIANIERIEDGVSDIKRQITDLNRQLDYYKTILSDLEATA